LVEIATNSYVVVQPRVFADQAANRIAPAGAAS
jgi:hypothetical protein